ncbi:Sip1-related alpha-galactosidase [Sunxiuqinia rutila]|uniref:Sip1-related alpha-galactosidase n=1 Tax=Sunxiuqinia rutila TaxID=1397841 RepID=UPI003D36FB58
MRKLNSLNIKIKYLALTLLVCLSSYTLHAQSIDLSKAEKAGIIEKKLTNVKPDQQGIIESDLLILPDFQRGVYYCPHVDKHAIGNRVLGIDFENLDHLRSQRIKLKANQPFEGIDMGSFICLQLNDNRYLSILAMAGESAFSTFTIREDGMWVDAGTFGTASFSGILPKIAYAFGETPHEASLNVWEKALQSRSLKSKTALRQHKEFPEPFKYTGYCTWEHIRRNMNTEILSGMIKDMETAEVPIRWMLIDDGYEDHENNHLLSFQPDKTKFSDGFQSLKDLKSEDGVRWIGQWWHMAGYFKGISPNHQITELNNHLFELHDGFMVPKTNQKSADIFYETRAKEMEEAEIDFIKVDFQTDLLKEYQSQPNPVQAASYNHRALEKAWQGHFDGLLNCIAQHHLHVFKHEKSATIRSGIDYHRDDENNRYIAVQNLRNSIYLGMTHWLDHDAFISSYHTGQSGAELRAVCGSPIYVSEDMDKVNFESIKPATWSDGELIRPLAPGTLTPEGFFNDPTETGLRVVAPLEGQVATFWLANFHNEQDLEIKLSPEEYRYGGTMIQPYKGLWESPKEGLVAFDYHEGKAWKMTETFSTKLPMWKTKIIHLIPVQDGWAIIGRPDKYLSPASCEIVKRSAKKITVKLKESAPFLIWHEKGKLIADNASVTQLAENLYRIEPTSTQTSITINNK